jgi:hypothetical protein
MDNGLQIDNSIGGDVKSELQVSEKDGKQISLVMVLSWKNDFDSYARRAIKKN